MLIASCIFILLGALCLLGGKIWQYAILKEENYKGRAVGTVAEIVAGAPDEAGLAAGIHDYYYPVVAFYAGGRLYKLQYSKGSNPAAYHLNERLDVHFDEKDPTKFTINPDRTMAILASSIYYLGFVFCCIGGIFFLLFATRY